MTREYISMRCPGALLKWVVIACAFVAHGRTASAETILHVSVNTTSLVGHPAGPFSILFALTDGSEIGDHNNTITVRNVDFGGGSALGDATIFGGANGTLETGL